MITAIAVDDEPLALDIIKVLSKNTDRLELKATFTHVEKALEYLDKNPVDLVFLDIVMPLMTGIDFCKQIRSKSMVIFTSAHARYAIEGFSLNAVDFLLKPFEEDRFQESVDKARNYRGIMRTKNSSGDKYLLVKIDQGVSKIAFADIVFIEGKSNYLNIHLHNGKKILVRMTLKAIEDLIPPGKFIRIHRSFIVAKERITSVRNKIICLGNIEIRISALYYSQVLKLLDMS